jgi:hypothetical protein
MQAMSGSHMQVGGLGSASGSQRVAARSDRCAAQQDSLLPHAASFVLARLSDKCMQKQALCSQRKRALDFGALLRRLSRGKAFHGACVASYLARDAAEGRGHHAICQPAAGFRQWRSIERHLHEPVLVSNLALSPVC